MHFTPDASVYAGQQCGGVNIIVTDRDALDAPELGLEIASALHKLYPEKYELGSIDTLLLNQSVLQALKQGEDPRRIADDGRQALDHFMQLRAKYLLY